MKTQNMSLEPMDTVPKLVRVSVERSSGYGSVPGLEEEELADPIELERQVFLSEWGPILALPCRSTRGGIRPAVDEFGNLDWGPFGTMDFDRLRPAFDKARYKADKLREQLRNDLIMLDIVRERVRPEARSSIRRFALDTDADVDSINDVNQWSYARWVRRIKHLVQDIRDLHQFIRNRRQQAAGPQDGGDDQ